MRRLPKLLHTLFNLYSRILSSCRNAHCYAFTKIDLTFKMIKKIKVNDSGITKGSRLKKKLSETFDDS